VLQGFMQMATDLSVNVTGVHATSPVAQRECTARKAVTEHIAWIDVARGVGILLVVLGHLETGLVKSCIYTFHMPLFFILSGNMHKVSARYAEYFRRRSIRLLVPYVAFLILLAPLELHRAARGGNGAVEKTILNMIWGGNRLTGDYGVFWFITCLFATQQLANWLLSRFQTARVVAYGAVSLVLAYVNSILFPRFMLPLDLGVIAGALPFYLIGYYARGANLDRWGVTLGAIVGTLATVWLNYLTVPVEYNMRAAHYGVPVLSLILAACCIIAVIRLSKAVLQAPRVAKLLEKIGAASIGIMFIHEPLSEVLKFRGLSAFPPFVAFALVAFISFACTVVLSRFSLGREIFLGSQQQILVSNHESC
jgi:fucose 4-O-acetylase-like acetyltransferase